MLIIKIITLFLILITNLKSQFVDVKITINDDRLQQSINNELDNFESNLENYLKNTEFASDAMDIDFSIEILFVFEGITDKGNEKVFSSQILATNNVDQQFFTKGAEFSYNPGQSFFYNNQFESLRSLIDYFALMIIAGDLDTYDLFGGEKYYKLAESIAVSGKESSFNRGWDNRKNKSEDIKENYNLRKAKLYFFISKDIFSTKNYNDDLNHNLKIFHQNILNIDSEIGNDKNTKIFLKSHANEIGLMLDKVKMYQEINDIIDYDKELKSVLEKFLPKSFKNY